MGVCSGAALHAVRDLTPCLVPLVARSNVDAQKFVLESAYQVVQQRLAAAQQAVLDVQSQLTGVKSATGPYARLAIFGAVPLAQAIHGHRHRFRRPPLGPIGALLTLQDARCGLLACATLCSPGSRSAWRMD
jgi:hypothetical protein